MNALLKFLSEVFQFVKALCQELKSVASEVEELLVRLFVLAGTAIAIWHLLERHF